MLVNQNVVLNGSAMVPRKVAAHVSSIDNHCEHTDPGTVPASSKYNHFMKKVLTHLMNCGMLKMGGDYYG